MKFVCFILLLSMGSISADELKTFLSTYCFSCHDSDVQKGDLNLESVLAEKPLVKNLQKWTHVIHMVKDGDMPPRDKKRQPSNGERLKFTQKLSDLLDNFDYSTVKNPGSEPVRRLSNIEYERTVNSLFGTKIKLVEKLNQDLRSEDGYTNSSETLFMQTSVLEKFYAAAEYAVSQALPFRPINQQETQINRKFVGTPQAAEKLIRNFMNRAYRRPVSTDDLKGAMAIYRSQSKSFGHEKAMRSTYEFVLASPRFLMKVESRDANGQISHWDMASRLSYFLWGTMPDIELFSLASQGKLHDSSVLKQQVARMMKDPKFAYIGENFGSQWLQYSEVGVRNRPDPIDNPQMTDSLYKAMKDESAMFFTYIMKKNKRISELLTADYTFLNEELAQYYLIGGIEGEHMRPVRLKTAHRGGILSHASILMVTSHPGRSSPILRGNWILTHLLGTPPPPPPANVGELEEDDDDEGNIADLLKRHSSKPECAGCHKKIDPLGLGLKNFDHLGKWRNQRPETVELDDGTKIRGLQGLKTALVTKRLKQLQRRVVEKTLSFALGRKLHYYDEPTVRKVLKVFENKQQGLRDMTVVIVQSYPFRFNALAKEK